MSCFTIWLGTGFFDTVTRDSRRRGSVRPHSLIARGGATEGFRLADLDRRVTEQNGAA
jgi:hypothetical protein